MTTWNRVGITLVALLQAKAAMAGCAPPETAVPAVPDGAKASREEMVMAQAAMKAYNATVDDYTQCVKKEGGSANELNRIVNQLEKLAVRFNAELRKYKQKAGS